MADSDKSIKDVDPLKYQKSTTVSSSDLMTIKLRYKKPDEKNSQLITKILENQDSEKQSSISKRFAFSSAVAEFGLLLRDSEFKAQASYEALVERARNNKGDDKKGFRSEFIRTVETAMLIKQK